MLSQALKAYVDKLREDLTIREASLAKAIEQARQEAAEAQVAHDKALVDQWQEYGNAIEAQLTELQAEADGMQQRLQEQQVAIQRLYEEAQARKQSDAARKRSAPE